MSKSRSKAKPEKDTVRVNFELPKDVHRKAKAELALKGETISEVCRLWLTNLAKAQDNNQG